MAVTAATKQMRSVENSSRIGSRKESGRPRKIRDELDVQKVVSVIKDAMVNPFDLA